MEQENEKTVKKSATKQTASKIMAYIGIQNEALKEGDPVISIRFPISVRLFCAALAVSRMENGEDKTEG